MLPKSYEYEMSFLLTTTVQHTLDHVTQNVHKDVTVLVHPTAMNA